MQQLTWINEKGKSTEKARELTKNIALFKGEKGKDEKEKKDFPTAIIGLDKLGIELGDEKKRIDPWPRRKRIYQQMCAQQHKYGSAGLRNLQVLLDLVDGYDTLFFNNQLRVSLKQVQRRELILEWSDKGMKKGCAGLCQTNADSVIIRIHPDVASIKIDQTKGECCNGIVCLDALSSLQLILEHELIHVVVTACLQLKCVHGNKFKQLAEHLFGHLTTTHEFGLGDGYARSKKILEQKQLLEQMQPGVCVAHQQSKLQGIVLRSAGQNMTLLLSDGTLLHKVPIAQAQVVAPTQNLAKLWSHFSRNKEHIKKGCTVKWASSTGDKYTQGTVLRTKPIMADIQLPNSSLQISIPYHTLEIVK